MLNTVLHNYGFNLAYAQTLTADISPEQMTHSSAGIANHPGEAPQTGPPHELSYSENTETTENTE